MPAKKSDQSDGAKGEVPAPKPHYHGHRERLRGRFREAGPDALADYELLEMLLYRSIPQKDTKPIAKDLIEKFGSFAEVLAAPPRRLQEVTGVKEATSTDLKIIHAAASRMTRGEARKRDVLSSWDAVLKYCRTKLSFENTERFAIIFLDKQNRVITDEVQQTGTVDHTPVYPREVVKRALELSATAIILVHNHPSGDPAPSRADITMTQQIVEIAKPLGILVHDHIIVGKNKHASFKELRLI